MLKLIYFKMRALAEAPQLLLNYSGVEYEYLMSWDHFDDAWHNVKPKINDELKNFLIIPLYLTLINSDIDLSYCNLSISFLDSSRASLCISLFKIFATSI